MIEGTEDELNVLLQNGNLGYYEYCEIIQIVLFSDDNAINYYTNIEFSSEYTAETPFAFLTKSPVSVTNTYKLAISRYKIPISQFVESFSNAAKNGIWKCNDKEVIIDDAFISDKKFVPQSDPTGGQYNIFVPLEYGLYGSNFMGNYYIYELFSRKTMLHEILQDDTIQRIQSEIKKCKLNFRLDKMQDRIGNVICKFAVETLISTPKLLGEYGIQLDFSIRRKESPHKYCLHVFQENDGVIYQNKVDDDFDCSTVKVEPNQSKLEG